MDIQVSLESLYLKHFERVEIFIIYAKLNKSNFDRLDKKDTTRMLRLEFSEADKHALNHERYHHPHPRVQQRMEALWLKSQGLPPQRIATLCAISGNTLRAYLKLYQAGGMEALKQLNF